MIDIRQLLSELTQVIGKTDFPDATTLAAVLDLDMAQATITKTKQGNLGVNGARLDGRNIGIACGIIPRREIWLLFNNSLVPYRDVKDEIFGADRRIQPSKQSAGFGVLFEIDGWTCGFTATSPEGNLDSLFCEDPKLASPY